MSKWKVLLMKETGEDAKQYLTGWYQSTLIVHHLSPHSLNKITSQLSLSGSIQKTLKLNESQRISLF